MRREDLDAQQIFDIKRSARLELAERAAKDKDILSWGKYLMPHKFFRPFCMPLHGYFIEIRGDEFTNTKAPRFHSKTTIKCVLIPLFQGIYEPETFQHYLNIQSTQVKALSINLSIRTEFEVNDDLKDLVGDMIGPKWTDSQFVLKNKVVYTAIGAGQSARGINYLGQRPDYIVGDDLYDDDHIHNPELTEKVNAWWWDTIYPARAQAKRYSMHVQGTANSQYDLLTKMESDATIKSRTFKAVLDEDKKTVLWPETISFEQLMVDKARMGTPRFMREMQNEPRDDSDSIIKREYLYKADGRSWEFEPHELIHRLTASDASIYVVAIRVGNDPSIGKKNENDYTGTALVFVTQATDGEGNEYWIIDFWEEHLSLESRIQQLVAIRDDQPAERPLTEVRIESIAGFNDYADEVIRRTNLPIKRVDWVPDKLTNLENRSHLFENGKVHLNKNLDTEKKDKLVHQLTTNVPQHDDIRDAVLLTLDAQAGDWSWV